MEIWAAELKLTYLSQEDFTSTIYKREFVLSEKVGDYLILSEWDKEERETVSRAHMAGQLGDTFDSDGRSEDAH